MIGTYWEQGNLNEIDIVAVNDVTKRVFLVEVKLNRKQIDLNLLKEKSHRLLQQLKGYTNEFAALSIIDM